MLLTLSLNAFKFLLLLALAFKQAGLESRLIVASHTYMCRQSDGTESAGATMCLLAHHYGYESHLYDSRIPRTGGSLST